MSSLTDEYQDRDSPIGKPASALPLLGALPERSVTVHSGDMGYTIGLFAECARYPRCMRQSGAVCVGSWIALIVALWSGAAEFVYGASALAALATALLITHVATYAKRRVARESGDGQKLGRRLALKTFVKAAASSVLLMAMNRPTFLSSQCGGWHGECDPCYRNFFLNEDPRGCHKCRSCTRSGRNCGYDNC